jgi:menaquinone-9 beta-reductase
VRSFDVVVVGGGPAGASAATTLARGGLRVIVADKAAFPRDKCCGDGLTTGALRILDELGLDPTSIPSWQWVDDVRLSTPRRAVRSFALPSGPGHFAAVATRVDLDAAVLQLARDAGAEVGEEVTLTGIRQTSDAIVAELTHRDGTVEDVSAAYLVAADGMWSTTRKLTESVRSGSTTEPGKRGYLGEWHGYRQYARNVHTEQSRQLWIWFEPDLLPGYLWSFPLANGRVNVGFGILREPGRPTKEMKGLWTSLLARPHVQVVLGPHVEFEDTPKAWPIPSAIGSASLADGRILYVGDAARACDVLTGEGIGQALYTGRIAANAILGERRTSTDSAGTRYETTLRESLFHDHQMSSALGGLISNKLVCEGAIRFSGSTSWTSRNFARWLFEDYPRGIALTPTKWRWGLMSGAGAFEGLRTGPPSASKRHRLPSVWSRLSKLRKPTKITQ